MGERDISSLSWPWRTEVMGLAVVEVWMAGVAHGNREMVGPWCGPLAPWSVRSRAHFWQAAYDSLPPEYSSRRNGITSVVTILRTLKHNHEEGGLNTSSSVPPPMTT